MGPYWCQHHRQGVGVGTCQVPYGYEFTIHSLRLTRCRRRNRTVQVTSVVFNQGDGLKAYLHQPFYEGGDMRDWLAKQQPSPGQLTAVLHQIVRGVEYLHGNRIVHCDLKLENVFMSSAAPNASPRIGDFDVSKDSDNRRSETTETAVGGTAMYLSPERFAGEPGSSASDIFALGLLILLATTESREELIALWTTISPADVQRAIAIEQGRRPDEEKQLCMTMLHPSASQRPTATQALSFPHRAGLGNVMIAVRGVTYSSTARAHNVGFPIFWGAKFPARQVCTLLALEIHTLHTNDAHIAPPFFALHPGTWTQRG